MTTTARLGFDIVATDRTGTAFNSAKKLLEGVQGVQNAVNGFAGPMRQAENATARFGSRVQNVSFQISDLAVQINGGTDATRALGQQLPQLLGGFGAFGAAAGAVAAILIPLALAPGKTRDYAKELSDGVEKLDAAQKITKATISDLTEEWGQNAKAIISVANAQEQLAKIDITRALVDQARAISDVNSGYIGTSGAFGEVANQWKNLDFSRSVIAQLVNPLDEATKSVNSLKDRFGLTEQAARALMGPFADFQSAIGNLDVGGASQALEQIANWIAQNGEAAKTAAPLIGAMRSQLEALSKINPVQQVTSALKQNYGVLGSPGETVVSKVGGSDSEAFKAAAAAAKKAATEFKHFLDIVDNGVTPLQHMQDTLREARDGFARFGDKMNPAQVKEYTAYIADLNKKITELAFKDKWDKMAKGIQTASQAMAPFRDMLESIGRGLEDNFVNGLTDAFSSFVDGTETAKEALRSFAMTFLQQMSAMIAKALILFAVQKLIGLASGSTAFGSLMQSYGGVYGNGLLSNANGNAFSGGRVIPFAKGGVVGGPTLFPMANGVGLMGEAGSEAIVPLSRRNGKLGVGASPVNVQINNYAGAEVQTRKGSDGQLQIDIVRKVVADDLARGGGVIAQGIERGYGLRRAGR